MAKVGRPIKFLIRLTSEKRTRLEGMIHCGKGAINSALKARILLKADVSGLIGRFVSRSTLSRNEEGT